jgi:SWI/SNF-related matrix-associated actin-dependent regulator of chromatin subfamily A member 5
MLRQYEFPLEQLYIPYGTNQKGRNYTEEEDRFLIVKLAEYGYMTDDVYELIRRDVLNDKRFRFDWFFKSRSGVEIGRRCQTLVNLLGREEEARKRQKLN